MNFWTIKPISKFLLPHVSGEEENYRDQLARLNDLNIMMIVGLLCAE